MSDKDVNVRIAADLGGFAPGMESAASSVASFAKSASGSLAGLVEAAGKAGGALAAVGAAAAIVGGLAELAEHVTELGVEFAKASQKTGIAASDLSALSFVAKASDVSFQSLVKGFQMMDRQLLNVAKGTGPAAEAFKALGVTVRDGNGHLKSNERLLNELADKFSSFKDGSEKAGLAQRVFGRAGAEMIPILNLGSRGIQQLKQDSDALGATMSGPLIEATEQYHHTMVEFHAALQGVGNVIAQYVIPWFTKLVQFIGVQIVQTEHFFGQIKIILSGIAQAIQTQIRMIGRAITQFADGDFKGAANTLIAMSDIVEKQWDRTKLAVQKDTHEMSLAIMALKSAAQEPGAKDGAVPGLPDDAAAAKAREFYLKTLVGAYKDAMELRMAALHEEEADVEGSAVSQATQVLAIKQQELAEIIQFYGQYTVEAIHAEAEVARQTKALHKAQAEETKQMLAQEGALWKSTFATISSTFNTVFDGLLRGTTTFRQAFGNMLLGLGADFIKILTKMGGQWAAHEALKTGILSSSLATRLGITTAADATGMAAQKLSAVGTISTDAAVGAAGAEMSVSQIPYIGPALAPAAGAETYALILSNLAGVASAAGGYDIPSGLNPVTQLHQSEMVLPAELADRVRGMSGGSGEVHLHVTAIDAKGVMDFFKANSAAVAASVKDAVRKGGLTLSPAGTLR